MSEDMQILIGLLIGGIGTAIIISIVDTIKYRKWLKEGEKKND